MDVEDDNISITSTAPSDFEAEYEVKTVLDERQTEYGMQYLVWWEGYPIERSTWEPKESFNNPQTLTDWEKKKHQIEAGERHPFDLPKFEQRLAKIERQRLERKRKRAEKRSRLGIEQPNTPQPDPLATSSAPSNPNERVTSQRRLSQENIPLTTRVKSTADKPRMVGFGKPNTSPAGPRSKATSAKESPVRFKLLSTQHKHNKAMARERAPDVNQLDLRRPSDWPSRNTNVTSLGHHFISPSHGGRSTQAPSESNDIRHDANTVRPDVAGRYSSQPAERTENEMPDHFPGLRQEDIEPRGLSIRGLADRALYDHNGKANPNSGYSHARESRAKGMPRLPSRRPRRGCHMTGESSGNRFWNLGEILIHMFYGPAKEEIGSARICGLPTTQKLTLLGSKKQTRFDLWFQHSCTYEEYRMLCNKASDNIKFGNGWIEGFDDTEPKIYNLGEELKTKGLMAICYPDGDESKLVLLAYSPDSSIFDFLGESRSTEPSFLTVAVRSPFTPVGQPKYHPTQQLSPPPAMSSPPAPPSAPSQSGGEKSIDADDYFKEKFGVTFADLATVQSNQGKRVANVFYLMFPLDNTVVQQECELFIAFLRNRGREPVIFSNRDPDDWQKFIGSSSEGVVIFHQSFVHHNTLRDLSKKALCHRSFNFWNVSIVRPLDHVDRPLHLQRIFPFGGAILLTEDFMISDPKGAAVILTWFNEWIRKQYKGTWKIMLRPDALNWLVKQHDLETVKEKAGYWLAMYRCVMEANTPDPNLEWADDYDISNINSNLESPPVISPSHLPGYGSRKEDDHPFIPKGLTQEQRNADHLMEFFAGLGLVHCDKFRRFIVITNLKPEPRWLSWQHIELYHGPKEFMRVFKIEHARYVDKIKYGDQPPPTGSTSSPSQDPRIQQSRTSASSNANIGTPADLDIPWRGPSQIRTIDSRPPGDTSTNPPRGPYSPRDAFSPRESFSPRDTFPPRDPRAPRSTRPHRGPQGADCYRSRDAYRSRESSPPRDYRISRESSPQRDPRLQRDAPAQRGSNFRGNAYYPRPYR